MNLSSLRRLLASGRCAWMLAWALCLPLAQVATTAHALQHLRSVAAAERDAPAQLPLGSCDLCLAGAAIGGAAPLPPVATIAAGPLPHAAPMAAPVTRACAPPPSFYSSRAPPLLHA